MTTVGKSTDQFLAYANERYYITFRDLPTEIIEITFKAGLRTKAVALRPQWHSTRESR